jgi:carboxymethylenebutenolidase
MYEENQIAPEDNVAFSRRDFVLTSLITGFALAVQPINAQDKITTDDKGLMLPQI